MDSRRGGAAANFFSGVSHGVIQKTSLQTFMGKSLTALNK